MTDSPASNLAELVPERRLAVVPTPLRRRSIDLANLTDVRREMGRIYRDMRVRRIDSQEGTRMVYVLSQIGKLIAQIDVEGRLEAIEFALGRRPKV